MFSALVAPMASARAGLRAAPSTATAVCGVVRAARMAATSAPLPPQQAVDSSSPADSLCPSTRLSEALEKAGGTGGRRAARRRKRRREEGTVDRRLGYEGMINLIGLTRPQIRELVAALGHERYRGDSLCRWLYVFGHQDFTNMTDIAKHVRSDLASKLEIEIPSAVEDSISEDGTRKWLLSLRDGLRVETVLIPEGERGTVCVSSQVGCSLACSFCHTGTQRMRRNLTAAEIVGQVMRVRQDVGEFPLNKRRKVSSVVFMGQGEPLYNFKNVATAIDVLSDGNGMGIGKRSITVSTSGVVPMFADLNALGVNLAVSLHATNDRLRDELVPINKQFPLRDLMAACHAFDSARPSRSILFEYVMLDGVNDSREDAKELAMLIKDLPSIVNIIPFNPWPGSKYRSSSRQRIIDFADELGAHRIRAPVRWPRGQDILAACGQLKSANENKKGVVMME